MTSTQTADKEQKMRNEPSLGGTLVENVVNTRIKRERGVENERQTATACAGQILNERDEQPGYSREVGVWREITT